jgi:hypothetical protein
MGNFSLRGPVRGPGGRAPSLGSLKDMFSKVLEWASVSIGALLLENMTGLFS